MNFHPMKHHQFYAGLKQSIKYNLSDACAQTYTLDELLDEQEKEKLHNIPLIYGSVPGADHLRAGISALYQTNTLIDDITVLSGAEEGLFSFMGCILKPGDEVIGFTPCYPSLSEMPKGFGAVFKPIALQYAQQWQPSLEAIENSITDKTKIIILNSPHNPTGMVLKQGWVDQLIALCDKHGIYILADEVSLFTDPHQVGTQINWQQYDKTVQVSVLSKSFGLAGVRIGWVNTQNQALTQKIRTLKTYNSICQSVLDEYVASIAMQKAPNIFDRNQKIVKTNTEAFDEFVQSNECFEWHKPVAGILGLVKSHRPLDPILQAWLNAGVLALKGDIFGIEGEYFRVGLGRRDVAAALEVIRQTKV